jgi:CheY-like chemotaxis protein
MKKEGEPKTILVIGRHADMLEMVKNLLIKNGYNAIGATTDSDALELFRNNPVDAVLIGGGVESASRAWFGDVFSGLNPLIKIINAHPQTVLSELRAIFYN